MTTKSLLGRVLVSLAFFTLGLAPPAAALASPVDVVINEIRIDQPGTDNDEYFELAGAVGTSLDGLTYLVIGDGTAGSGVIEVVVDLSGQAVPGSGFFIATESTFTLGTADLTTDLNFENSDNVTHLLVEGFSGADGDDLDTDDDGTLDVEPWSAVVDLIALIEEPNPPSATEFHYGPPTVGPDGSFVPGHVFRCDSSWLIGPFDPAGGKDTPGAENACEPPPPPEACGDPYTAIYDIQGSGLVSPLLGLSLSTEGIVIGDFQNNGQPDNGDLNGFHIQDPVGDGDPATSDGIFVFAPGAMDVEIGDRVRVHGEVAEFFNLTEISNASLLLECSTGHSAAPTPVTLPVTDLIDLEAYEGMLVSFPQKLFISEYFNFDRFGEIVLTTDRQYQPTAIFEPSSPQAMALALENSLSRITLDDGRSSQNPDPAIHPNGAEFTLSNRFRGGDTVASVTGVMDFAFGLYRIQPTEGADYTAANARPADPPNVDGSIRVVAFNVLNYFTTLDEGGNLCGPPGFEQGCRGADGAEELARQRAKIVAALAAMEADVVGLIEIQNDTDETVADLVAGLNDMLGAGTYDYISTGFIGTDAIKQAFIYKSSAVTPVGAFAVLDSDAFVDPNHLGDQKNRPALAQTFMDNERGGEVTVVVNHLKSKGSACGPGDDDPVQGNCNLTRTLAAQQLLDWLATEPTGSDAGVLIIGDLNSYDKEDPIDVLLGAGYIDLLFERQGELAYNFLFDGQLGYLEYALASPELIDSVSGAAAWHINTDEPDILDYDTTFKQPAQAALYEPNEFRSSDHDPVVVGLDVCEMVPPTLEVSVSPDTLWPANHFYVDVAATVVVSDNFDDEPTVTLLSVTSNEPDDGLGDGDTADDIVVLDDLTFQLRAERSGTGEGRVYTITYQAIDDCGNSTAISVEVTAPMSQTKK